MSENSESKKLIDDPSLVKIHGSQDGFLRQLITLFAEGGIEVGLSLSFSGLIVTGTLISAKTYFSEMETFFKDISAEKPETEALFLNTLSDVMAKWAEVAEENETPPENQPRLGPNFIHLRNATFFNPGQGLATYTNKPHWRGKLSSIDGFIFGELSATPSIA